MCSLLVNSPEPVCNKSRMTSCLPRAVRLLQDAQQCFHPQMCFQEHKKNSSKTRGKTSVTFQVNMLMLDTDRGEIICLSWLEKSNSCITLLFIHDDINPLEENPEWDQSCRGSPTEHQTPTFLRNSTGSTDAPVPSVCALISCLTYCQRGDLAVVRLSRWIPA